MIFLCTTFYLYLLFIPATFFALYICFRFYHTLYVPHIPLPHSPYHSVLFWFAERYIVLPRAPAAAHAHNAGPASARRALPPAFVYLWDVVFQTHFIYAARFPYAHGDVPPARAGLTPGLAHFTLRRRLRCNNVLAWRACALRAYVRAALRNYLLIYLLTCLRTYRAYTAILYIAYAYHLPAPRAFVPACWFIYPAIPANADAQLSPDYIIITVLFWFVLWFVPLLCTT